MKRISFLIAVSCFYSLALLAQQRPVFVPFKVERQTGLMDTSGKVIKAPGAILDYYVVGNFQYYILKKDRVTNTDMLMNAVTGRKQYVGEFDVGSGVLRIGNNNWYHFVKNEQSFLVDPVAEKTIALNKGYVSFTSMENAWDNEAVNGKQYLFGINPEETYEILDAANDFKPVAGLPVIENYDVVLAGNGKEAAKIVGYVFGNEDTILREKKELYNVPESDGTVLVYDVEFKKLGKVPYKAKEIGKLFKKDVFLRGAMMAPPQIKDRRIGNLNGKVEQLNMEYRIVKRMNKVGEKTLVLERNGEPVFKNGKFDFRYIGMPGLPHTILQMRNAASSSFFYFDYNGVLFPKGVPMIPREYRSWEQ